MGSGRRRWCADTCQRTRALLGNVVLGLGEGGGGGARGGLLVQDPVNHERGAGLEVWAPAPPTPPTSSPAGSGGAGSVEGSERVRRAETPLRRIGGAGGERRNSGHLKGAPGARRAFVRRYRGDALGGERRGRVCLVRGILFGDPEFLSGLGGRGCSRRGVFWEVAWPPVGLLFKNWQRKKKRIGRERRVGLD